MTRNLMRLELSYFLSLSLSQRAVNFKVLLRTEFGVRLVWGGRGFVFPYRFSGAPMSNCSRHRIRICAAVKRLLLPQVGPQDPKQNTSVGPRFGVVLSSGSQPPPYRNICALSGGRFVASSCFTTPHHHHHHRHRRGIDFIFVSPTKPKECVQFLSAAALQPAGVGFV